MTVTIRDALEADRAWIRSHVAASWGLPVVSVSGSYDPTELAALVASAPEATVVGVATYRLTDTECEVLTLDALVPRRGVGTALLGEVRRRAGRRRVWLITTDENHGAIAFYRHLGMQEVRRHHDFVSQVRSAKDLAAGAVGFRDALEFEFDVERPST